jgi:hypothetical protein
LPNETENLVSRDFRISIRLSRLSPDEQMFYEQKNFKGIAPENKKAIRILFRTAFGDI